MGDRRNVILNYGNEATLTIYSHWTGYRMHTQLADALEFGKSRWSDDPYLGRVLISKITQDALDGVTGYGVLPGTQSDEEHANIEVDLVNARVTIGEHRYASDDPHGSWSFEDFVAEFAAKG